ncbi:MAG: leucine-rich repeat protein [Bacteroidales bacterium]|nr:leucine-rich repeat protein [Bacteroidales bacterium]
MNKLYKLLIIALILIMGGNTLKAENLTATRNSDTELVTKNQDLHYHDNFINNDNHVVSALAASAAAAADLTVTIDTGGKVTLKDADGDGYYEISTADELYAFAAAVNGGNRAINGKLTANIVVNQNMLTADGKLNGNGSNFRVWIPIGNTTYPYMGAFEGNGNTVSGLYFNDSSSYDIGLFGRVYEVGKVQNVGVVDSYFNGKGTIGGVVGTNYGTVENCYSGTTVGGIDHSIGGVVGSNNPDGTVRNCHSVGSVNSTASYVGGVVGFNHADGIVENCSNTGTVSNDGNFVGGVVGDNYGTVQNCYNTGAVSGTGIRVGGVLGINGASGTVTNCYYLNGCAKDGNSVTQFGIGNATAGSTTPDEAGKTTAMSSDQFASGEACADLGNHIGLDVANGFCNLCTYQPATLNSDGYYEIFNAGQLYWFANHINTVDRTASAVLTADIDLENRQWIPIGWYDNAEQNLAFAGIFNGNEKTISHLYYNGTDNYFGMFGYSTGEIRDLIIHNSSIHTDSDGRVGMIVGRNAGLIEKCANFGNVSSTGNFVGGICGVVDAGTVRNCYNTGSIKGNYNIGGISGNVQYGGTVENCYSCGSVETSATYTHLGGGITGVLADDVVQPNPSSVINCYHDNMVYSGNTIGNANEGSVINSAGKTTEQFASGEVTYLLQGEQENHIWGQNIDNGETIDAYPVIGGAKVYPISCGGIPYKFSNVEIENLLEHNFENGFCSVCGEMDVPELKDNYYQIENAGQLYWFANHINTVDRTASAVLTADIDLEGKSDGTGRKWTPIGSTGENSHNFRGHFDGRNHTITNLYVDMQRAGLGFFGEVRLGVVENFTIYGDVKLTSDCSYVGGVIGSAPGANGTDVPDHNGATVRNITSYVNVTLDEGSHGSSFVGGFMGYANHETIIENCSWYGTLDLGANRADSGVGGFIGRLYDTSDVTVRNCAAYGTIKTAYKSGTFENYSTIYIGGFLSYSPAGAQTVLENNLWAGEIINNTDLEASNAHLSAFGTMTSFQSITNCYALNSTPYVTTNNENDNGITTVTAERLASGEIAYLLQGEQETQVWGQNIDNGEMADAYPVLGGAKVYKHTFDFGNINVYSNLETLDMTPHGKCGDYLYWNITDSTLTIFGTGAMYDYALKTSPWYTHKESLKTLVLEEGMTSIGKYAFYSCNGFAGELIIPNSVTSIGYVAFNTCKFTGSLTIPNNVTSIGDYAFTSCNFRGSLTIGNSVTSIGRNAFSQCYFTGSLIIPNSVTYIGNEAFNCYGLTDIFFYRNESPSIAYINTFANINSNAKIYAPVIWESFTNIPEDKLVKMPTFVGQQTTGNGQQTSSTGWVFPEGQTEISAEDHVAINAPLVLGQQTTDNSQQTLSTLTVKSFGYCGDGTTTNGSITIEEGGQLYCETARGEVTVRKEIIGYAGQQTTDNGQQTSWYTIASPLKEVVDLSNSNTFITSTPFDLYRYDEPTHTWQNAKPGEGSTNFQTIESGRGYLYANAENTTLEFKGNINTEDVNYTLTAQSEVLNGFHLVGNPYTHDISFNHLSADAELANGYYVLNGEGAWGATLGNEGDVIKVGQGALIKTTNAGTLTISRDASTTRKNKQDVVDTSKKSTISLTVSNAKYSDRAFVVFDKGVGLDKINHENENIPLLYIPQDDTDYAIAMMDENVSEIPVSFEAMTMGQYTISLQQENCDFDELYLLDKETGEKVNILEEDYTFMATTADNAERFVLTMNSDNDTDSDNGNFAYISGEDLIISVEGAVQIIDVMGRIIYSNDVTSDNNRIDVSVFDNAAYIVRVVNENGVKVQKIIL